MAAVFGDEVTNESNSGTKGPYARELYRFFMRRFRSNHLDLVDDLVQEVYIRARVWKRAATDAQIEKPLAYLYGIAKHVMADHYTGHMNGTKDMSNEDFVPLDEDSQDKMVAPDLTVRLEAIQELKVLMADLPETHKQVLILHKIYGLEYADVVEYTGLSIHTVEKYVTQAIMRMRLKAGVWGDRPEGCGWGRRGGRPPKGEGEE